ncbi:hypothetical protein QBC47DRAFT_189924 [Echria macrotheca]|uniref:Uncharacterized protein n=1 Tax=Echria macrotheca TaxID=438768 RepID=A0AAJ0BDU7_9PEZI|nr:hypothetical protein QBC47DRAFT_189924 [Echria macrotheca]
MDDLFNAQPYDRLITDDAQPIFLRVCHSPWSFISQSTLVSVRAAIVTYLTVLGIMLWYYKTGSEIHVLDEGGKWKEYSNLEPIFQFSTIAFLYLWVYHVLTFCWAFAHLNYRGISENDNRLGAAILRWMAPPALPTDHPDRFSFSLFFLETHVYVLMNAIMYWAVLVPTGHDHFPKDEPTHELFDSLFGHGWFQPFCIISLWGITALVAIIEILFLNKIKYPVPASKHLLLVAYKLTAYLGWAALGYLVTGRYPFFWMSRKEMKSGEAVMASCAGFVATGPLVSGLVYALIYVREQHSQ